MSSKKGNRAEKFKIKVEPWKKRGHSGTHGKAGPHADKRTKRNRTRNNQKTNWRKENER